MTQDGGGGGTEGAGTFESYSCYFVLHLRKEALMIIFLSQKSEFHWLLEDHIPKVLKQLQDILKVW